MQRFAGEGSPRDLGLDQGRACRDALRADARALGWEVDEGLGARLWGVCGGRRPRALAPRPALARDLARHFPHLDERVSGMAAGAGLPREALLALLEEELADLPVVAAGRAPGAPGGGALVVRLRTPLPPTGLVARTLRPDGGHPFLALTRPGLVASLAGVNACGLGGAIAALDPPSRTADRCGVASALLLDQCLERLDTVEKALEWCERRPGGGRARLVFADASGAAAALDLDGDARVRDAAPALDDAALSGLCVRIDPPARALELLAPGAPPERLALDAAGPAPRT